MPGEEDLFEVDTACEGTAAEASYGTGDNDVRDVTAIGKSVIADGGDAVRNGNGHETGAIAECLAGDIRDAVGDDDVGDAGVQKGAGADAGDGQSADSAGDPTKLLEPV